MSDPAPALAGRVFISYRREETAYPAGWLYDRLVEHFDGEVFKDIDSIELGEDWVEAISGAVASCDVMLALIGDEWLAITDENGRRRLDDPSDFVRVEIETALNRHVRVIPILVDGAQMPRATELPSGLAPLVRRQAMELSPARFDFDTRRLLDVLDTVMVEVRGAQERRPAASGTSGERMPPHHRPSDQTTATGRGDGVAPGRGTVTTPPATSRRHPSRRQVVPAGLGACPVIVAVLGAIAILTPDDESGSERADDTRPASTPPGPGTEPVVLVASFEDGVEGWRPDPDHPDIGSVTQVSDFHTDGSFSLQVDSAGVRGEGWYGVNGLRLDITGGTTINFDIMTLESGTETAVAVQYGNDEWCQLSQPWDWVPPATELRAVSVDLETLECADGEPTARSRNTLTAVWVWFAGKGSFGLDNVRVE